MTATTATSSANASTTVFRPWNLGRLIGQKPPLKLREVWAIRIRLQMTNRPSGNLLDR